QGQWLSFLSKMMVRALARQGKVEDARRYERFIVEPSVAFERATKDHVRALILHAAGQAEQAERMFRRAMKLVDPDALPLWGEILMDLAETLRALGREDEARRSAAEALYLFERKGDVVSAERARAFGA